MPKLSTFMYCEQSRQEQAPDGKSNLVIINPLNVFRPAFIPGMFSFSVVFGLTGIDVTEKKSILQIKFFNHENEKPIVDTGEIPIVQHNNENGQLKLLPIEARGIMANLDFRNVVLKKEGEYFTKVYLDQELLGEIPIYVKVGDQID